MCQNDNNWKSVPQFGKWENKAGNDTNYSMMFSAARENRKQNKKQIIAPNSIGSERELLPPRKSYFDEPVTPKVN
ncbi:hypothetical protein Leryth_003963 [Lithospermum erythrorhizon]|nr:hypothetical protein Leryth_003963 [Lithospermum erythrorhizon]